MNVGADAAIFPPVLAHSLRSRELIWISYDGNNQ